MSHLWAFLASAVPSTTVAAVVGYFFKLWVDRLLRQQAARQDEVKRQLDQFDAKLSRIGETSLAVKKELRDEERGELVACRVAIEEWEDFLQNVAADFAILPAQTTQIAQVYQQDRDHFLKLKISVVKVGIYLRDEHLEQQLMGTITELRNAYYPLINRAMDSLIDLQSQLLPLELKLSAFEKSGMTDSASAPTEADRQAHDAIQARITAAVDDFATGLLTAYPTIASHLNELKAAINAYVYRPIKSEDIDEKVTERPTA